MKKNNISKVLALTLSGIMALSVVGCGSGNAADTGTADTTATETADAASGEKTKIVMSTFLTDDTQRQPVIDYVQNAVNEKFPDVDFKLQIYSDRQNLMVEVAGGAGPDILDLDGPTDVVEFANAGKALDLTAYAEQYGWKDILYDWAYNTSLYKGKLYSMPAGYEGMGMYYNMDVMNEHGWTIPKNLEEMETLMAKIKEAGLIPLSFGNANYQGAVDHLYSTILSCYSGPDVVKKAIGGEIKFDDPEMVKSIELLKKWWDEGYIMDQSSQSVTQDDQLAFIADGRAVMSICGTWWGTQFIQSYPDTTWQFELMPVLNEEAGARFPLAVGESYAINGNSANPDKCAEILNFLYTDMDQFYTAINNGAIQPFPIDAFDFTKLEGLDDKVMHMYEVMSTASENNQFGYCSWSFWPADARIYMNENFDGVLLDQLSPADYMANTQEYIDAAIADGSTPQLP